MTYQVNLGEGPTKKFKREQVKKMQADRYTMSKYMGGGDRSTGTSSFPKPAKKKGK